MTIQPSALVRGNADRSEARVAAALGFAAAFLACEPAIRALLWWRWPDTALPAMLHSSTNWLVVGMLICLGTSLLPEIWQAASRRRWLVGLGLVWALGAFVSSTMIENLNRGVSLRWVIYLVFALHFRSALRRQPERSDTILLACAGGFLGFSAVLVAFIGLAARPASFDWVADLPGAFNVRNLGFEAMAAALIGSLFRPADRRPAVVGLLRVSAVAGWAFLFWSGGRGSLLAAVVALAVAHMLSSTRERQERLVETLCLIAAGAGLALLHVPSSESFGFWRAIGFSAAAGGASEDVSSGRLVIWKESVEAIVANPLFGIGEAQMKHRFISAGGLYPQPHNLLLQAPLAWGIPAGLAFLMAILFLLFRALKRLHRQASLDSPAIAGLAVALAMFANAFVDGTLFHPRPVTLFLVSISLALTASLRNEDRPD